MSVSTASNTDQRRGQVRKIRPVFANETSSRTMQSMPREDLKIGIQSPDQPLGWDQAVVTAAAVLNDTWTLPETRCHSAGAGVEEELAAFLCAFGALS
jgi:hypothetical protein